MTNEQSDNQFGARIEQLRKDVDQLKQDHATLRTTLNNLAETNQGQSRTLHSLQDKTDDIHDALLGTIDGDQPGLVNTIAKHSEAIERFNRIGWTIVKPLAGLLGLGLLYVVYQMIEKGMK